MSRIGKKPITIVDGVTIEQKESIVVVTGPRGSLEQTLPVLVSLKQEDGVLSVVNSDETKVSRSNQGLTRSLINNMVEGVTKGFKKMLEVEGVGFKVNVTGNTLKLALGYSHDVNFKVPEDLNISNDGNKITIEGSDKQRVGQIAAEIRSLRKPEPYKGKGIHYEGEQILRKAGKAAGGE